MGVKTLIARLAARLVSANSSPQQLLEALEPISEGGVVSSQLFRAELQHLHVSLSERDIVAIIAACTSSSASAGVSLSLLRQQLERV
jgi:hypothetical protein